MANEPRENQVDMNHVEGKIRRTSRASGMMRAARILGGWLLAALIVGGGYFAWHGAGPSDEPSAVNATPEETPPVVVTLGQVMTRKVRRTIEVVGTLHAYEDISVSANVEGRIKRLHADVAGRVAGGELLAEIDPTNYELNVQQAERALDVELARLGLDEVPDKGFNPHNLPMIREARSRLEFAQTTERRTQQLSRSNAVSAQDLESAEADLESAQAEYENQVLQARAALETLRLRDQSLQIARQQLVDTRIQAPVPEQKLPFVEGGRLYAVASRSGSEGTFVRAGTEVFRLVIDEALRLKVAVPERFLSEIAVNQIAEVTTASYPDPLLGRVERINPVISPTTRSFDVEILIDNTQHRLKPGGFAKAEIITLANDTATTVPLESIVTFAGITKVFTVQSGRVKEVQVTLGEQGQDWVEILSPKLTAGQAIVTSGQSALADGTAIRERGPAMEMTEGPERTLYPVESGEVWSDDDHVNDIENDTDGDWEGSQEGEPPDSDAAAPRLVAGGMRP